MPIEYLNNGLEPPERPEKDTDTQIQDLLDWVIKTYKPEDLFPIGVLMDWAERNEYILPNTNK